MADPGETLEQADFEDLARHGGFAHAVALEIADGAAEAGQAQPAEMVAGLGQGRIGVADHSQAISFASLAAERFGDHQRIASPAGHDSHATRSCYQGKSGMVRDWGLGFGNTVEMCRTASRFQSMQLHRFSIVYNRCAFAVYHS